LFKKNAEEKMSLHVKLLGPDGKAPERKSSLAAGYDIYSAQDVTILGGEHFLVSTQLSVAVPEGHYGRVAPRSGLACKYMVDVLAGVIDSDYRGEIKVVLVNHGKNPFIVTKGDRIAQLILEKISMLDVVVVKKLDETERGEGGFGSTGVK